MARSQAIDSLVADLGKIAVPPSSLSEPGGVGEFKRVRRLLFQPEYVEDAIAPLIIAAIGILITLAVVYVITGDAPEFRSVKDFEFNGNSVIGRFVED